MTDENAGQLTYLPGLPYVPPTPTVRLTVTYGEANTAAPESVEVEWFSGPSDQTLAEVLTMLLPAGQRFAVPGPQVDQCRRLLCGHDRKVHAVDGTGQCLACGNPVKCATFVGLTPDGPVVRGLHVIDGGTE